MIQAIEQVVRTNQRRKQDVLAQCTRYEIEHKEIVDEMVGQARIAEMEAKSKMDVLIGQVPRSCYRRFGRSFVATQSVRRRDIFCRRRSPHSRRARAGSQAKGDLEVAAADGAREAERIVRSMNIKCEERRVNVDQVRSRRPKDPCAAARAWGRPPRRHSPAVEPRLSFDLG